MAGCRHSKCMAWTTCQLISNPYDVGGRLANHNNNADTRREDAIEYEERVRRRRRKNGVPEWKPDPQ